MDVDWYDDDLPEIRTSWAESISKNKDTVKTLTKVIGIPLSAFAASCAFNYWIKKKMEAL